MIPPRVEGATAPPSSGRAGLFTPTPAPAGAPGPLKPTQQSAGRGARPQEEPCPDQRLLHRRGSGCARSQHGPTAPASAVLHGRLHLPLSQPGALGWCQHTDPWMGGLPGLRVRKGQHRMRHITQLLGRQTWLYRKAKQSTSALLPLPGAEHTAPAGRILPPVLGLQPLTSIWAGAAQSPGVR